MNYLLALLPLWILGFSVTRVILKESAVRQKNLLAATLAFPLGFALESLILFWSYVFFGASTKKLTLAATFLMTAGILYSFFKKSGLKKIQAGLTGFKTSVSENLQKAAFLRHGLILGLALGFIFLLINYTDYFIGKVSWNIFGGWDAQTFWNLKAKFYFRDPSAWKLMFDPALDWSHPDYPLMLPGSLAWGWMALGFESFLWPALVDYLFFIPLCLLVVWYLASYINTISAFLAGGFMLNVHMFRFWSATQYADIAVSLFFCASTLFLILGFRHKESRLIFFSALLAGFSAWTKNEGLFFVGWHTTLLVLGLLFASRELERSMKQTYLMKAALGFAVALSAVGFSKVFLGLEGGEYLGSGRNLNDYFNALFLDPEKTQFILACFGYFKISYEQWQGLWILFGLTLFAGAFWGVKEKRWIFPAMILLVELGYFVVLHWAPWDIKSQIQYSLMRLMMHVAPLALLYAFEVMGLSLNLLKHRQERTSL